VNGRQTVGWLNLVVHMN